jgi:hypothetical protein
MGMAFTAIARQLGISFCCEHDAMVSHAGGVGEARPDLGGCPIGIASDNLSFAGSIGQHIAYVGETKPCSRHGRVTAATEGSKEIDGKPVMVIGSTLWRSRANVKTASLLEGAKGTKKRFGSAICSNFGSGSRGRH